MVCSGDVMAQVEVQLDDAAVRLLKKTPNKAREAIEDVVNMLFAGHGKVDHSFIVEPKPATAK